LEERCGARRRAGKEGGDGLRRKRGRVTKAGKKEEGEDVGCKGDERDNI
jgi:hypothetical protein